LWPSFLHPAGPPPARARPRGRCAFRGVLAGTRAWFAMRCPVVMLRHRSLDARISRITLPRHDSCCAGVGGDGQPRGRRDVYGEPRSLVPRRSGSAPRRSGSDRLQRSERTRTRALAARVWARRWSVDHRIAMIGGAISTTGRRSIHPAWELLSRLRPARAAALRVAVARDGAGLVYPSSSLRGGTSLLQIPLPHPNDCPAGSEAAFTRRISRCFDRPDDGKWS
jgi:hypothetical protein